VVKGYRLASNNLPKMLHAVGWSTSKLGARYGVTKSRAQQILSGNFPISMAVIDQLVELVQGSFPEFTLDPKDLIEDGYLSEKTGVRMHQCRVCGRWFEPSNPRVYLCSDECVEARHNGLRRIQIHRLDDEPEEETKYKPPKYAESCYDEARRRHINYGDVQKERTLAEQPGVLQRWREYQRKEKSNE
jgi:transcriptional regulator with XRE-family HTH domain